MKQILLYANGVQSPAKETTAGGVPMQLGAVKTGPPDPWAQWAEPEQSEIGWEAWNGEYTEMKSITS